MSAAPRIIYHLTRASGPSGGIKVMLEHVEILRAAGFEAFAYTKNLEQRPIAFEFDVPFLSGAIGITPRDIIVRPETYSAKDLEAAAKGGLWQTVFAQNHYYCRHSLGAARSYAALGVDDVFCASPRIKRFLEDNEIARDVPVVPCAIEIPAIRVPDKIERIVAMPRKRPLEFGFIKHLFALRHPELVEIPWLAVENMSHREALAALSASTIFLSLQRFEGFGLPALEAMAAGCVVAGFAGDGGWDYATAENGIWIGDDALEEAADALARVARGLREADRSIRDMIDAGQATAARYAPEIRNRALVDYFEALLSRGPSVQASG
ncbi:MAG: glycosyltransferase [Alphaproteobacteria bacterium]|nr:glycosyltransferase [Alphaproteobacteria bacterium]